MPLPRLYAYLNQLLGGAGVDLRHPLFAHPAHLAVFNYSEIEWAVWTRGVAQLPRLTHLSFPARDLRVFRGLLARSGCQRSPRSWPTKFLRRGPL